MALVDALLLDPYPLNIWIASRTDGVKGSGTVSDPFDGSSQPRFDAVMALFQSQIPADVTIHLGPGEFQTKGWNASTGTGAWQARAGMRIVGSGVDVTSVKLVGVGTAAEHYYAIGHPLSLAAKADFFSASDLAIDCGLPNDTQGGSAACGAIQILGNHVRICRVKATRWGTRSTSAANACFVFAVIAALPGDSVPEIVNSGIEDCQAIDPSPDNDGFVTVFHVGMREAQTSTNEGFAKSPFIRNCFADCGVATPTSDPSSGNARFRGLSMSWCRGGVVEGNHIWNADIGGPYPHQANRSVRDIIVRNNYYRNVGRGPSFNHGALGSDLAPPNGSLSRTGSVATITGMTLTGLAVGDRVKLGSSPATFNGVYVITGIQGSQFTVSTPVNTDASASVTSLKKVFGLSRAILEGNVIELADGVSAKAVVVEDANDASPYVEAPDYVHGDIFVRNNKIRYVDGMVPTGQGDLGLEVKGAKNLAVSSNIIESANKTSLQNRRCGSVKYFNDKTPSGVLIQGLNGDTNTKYDELETDAEDAFVLAMFGRRR